jgi:hypothetical protein
MTLDLDTLLVALYTITDDLYLLYFAHLKPNRPGQEPVLSDSEVLTLAIYAQGTGRSERSFVGYAKTHLKAYFPRMLSQSAFNRRCRDLAGVLVFLVPLVARELKAFACAYQVIDTTPLPLMQRCRGDRHKLFGDEASIGRGGSDKDWYYGCKLLSSVSPDGIVSGFLLAPASTEDRWMAEAFLCWRACKWDEPISPSELPPSHRRGGRRVGPTGPIWPTDGVGEFSLVPYIADVGFSGQWWIDHWRTDYGALVFTADSYKGDSAPALTRQHSGWRQIVETVNGQLLEVFGLAFPGARTKWGLLSRVAAKLVALNMGIWINRLFGRPDLALASLFNC